MGKSGHRSDMWQYTLLTPCKGSIQYVAHVEGHGAEMFDAVCKLGLEGIVSKKTECAISIWPIEKLDQSEDPKAAAVTPVL
jgi:hypothetical protein